MTLGLRKPVPLLPLMTEIVRLFVPVRSALAGMANVYVWLIPRQVPRVTIREFLSVGAGESLAGELKPPMEIAGRPPANEAVVTILSVAPSMNAPDLGCIRWSPYIDVRRQSYACVHAGGSVRDRGRGV